jgi:hypothetical protein
VQIYNSMISAYKPINVWDTTLEQHNQ